MSVKRELTVVSFFFNFRNSKTGMNDFFFTATSFWFKLVCEELDFADSLFILLFRLNGILFRKPVGDVTFAN